MWWIFLKGFAMGAADIVPGVSGGTIAFISGIYERLINALAKFSPTLIRLYRQQGFAVVWQTIDGFFLSVLFAGILSSVFTLSRLISYLLSNFPSMVWGFFLGLIIGSVWFVLKAIKHRTPLLILYVIAGGMLALMITSFSPMVLEPTSLNLFLSGAIAICAMILPGVSGSFLLLLLGMYAPVISAVKGFDLVSLGIFASGCIVGLLSFTHILNWALKRFYDVTMAVLTGFMIGALNKVWPWKNTVEYRFNPQGIDQPIVQTNLSPFEYEALTGEPSHWPWVLLLVVMGIVLVVLLEQVGSEPQKAKIE
jgi:putative membrane protein